jgi:hypothetical protein
MQRSFIYNVVSFCMVGISLYALAHLYTILSADPIIKHTKKCKYCKQRINEKVVSTSLSLVILLANAALVHPMHKLHELARWPRGARVLRCRVRP